MKTVLYCVAFAFIMVLNSCDSNKPTSLSEKTDVKDTILQQIPQTATPLLPTASPIHKAADIKKTKSAKVKPKTNSLNLAAETQKFTLKRTRDTTIFGANGTRIFIPAACFMAKNKKRIKGNIQLVLKECYRPQQMIKERLSTLCGNQLLASEGMIHIEAYANKQKLQLKKGKRLVVHFPKRKKEFADMNIFYGKTNQEGNVVWKKETQSLDKRNPYQSNTNYKASFQQKYKNSDISDIDEAELNYYIFNANELGWVNCDRFYKSTAKKIDYIVQTDSAFDGQVSLIFKDFRGVLIGEKTEKGYIFKNIPINERIDIVAMKSGEKGLLFAMKQTTTSEKPYRDLAFKPLKVADLDKEIENLL